MLRLSEKNGAVESLVVEDGRAASTMPPQTAVSSKPPYQALQNHVVPAAEAFTLQLLDGKGDPTHLKSSEFAFETAGGGRGATALPVGDGRAASTMPPRTAVSSKPPYLTWRHANGLVVRMEITAVNGEFRFRPSVEGVPSGMLLEWFDGPQVCVKSDRTLYWPYFDGVELTNFSRRYTPVGFRDRNNTGKRSAVAYPGFCQMQFLAAYKDGQGVYFSAVDERHTPKGVTWERVDGDTLRLSLQTFCGDLDADGAWRPKFHYSLRPYEGGWMEACGIYRDWVRTLPDFKTPPNRPKWMYDSPVNLIYPVRGEGKDSGRDMKPNCYFPYMNAMPAVEKYGKLLDTRIMALLMHWEGTAPWAPPYVWPPLGGEGALAKFRDALHARGDLLGVYCSGTAWTQISSIDPSYSLEQRFEDEHLGRYMMRGPKGEITASTCNGFDSQRLGYDMCLAEPWCIGELDAEGAKMAKFGIDYCQFFDQNLGGGWQLCYAKHHPHPPIPGAWMTDAMLAFQKRLLSYGMAVGCENAAAAPYVKNLLYNDSRSHFAFFLRGRPVHGLAFVFHEWSLNFSGNMCGINKECDPFWRWSYCFHNGDMFSLVLGADGKLVDAWKRPWNEEFPSQNNLVALVKRMNDMRKRHPSFLLEGYMISPFLKCKSRPAKVCYDIWGSKGEIETEEVLTSFWGNAKGERIGFASNWCAEPSQLKVTHSDGHVETRTLAPFEVIELKD